ncbi:MAG: DUF2269 domain-containing protein [Gammaproteobacteria bacterium]|nr:DUF2269 domain-containing protein [Gammaproteobacteria bacterium]MDH3373832.1 DUF2269 domain-containing protein [Gammaproteobacteria bacterium]
MWKLLHIVSVVVFLGNITTGLFWAARARKSRNLDQIASTFEIIILSDRWLTVPGVIEILVSGIAGAVVGKLPILSTGWILWPVLLFLTSGLVFSAWIGPLQRKILTLARSAGASERSWTAYCKLYKSWELWGLAALLTPQVALVIMVLKPTLPAM